jgi:hypothetical protein
LNVFIDSMPNATKAKVDALVEKLFVPIRSTKKSDFPRMNFKGVQQVSQCLACTIGQE